MATFATLLAAIGMQAFASPAQAADGGTRLDPQESLRNGQSLISRNKLHRLVMQADGNLVLYNGASQVAWTNHMASAANKNSVLIMQGDGNLVQRNPRGTAVWNSGTPNNTGARFIMQNDGNAVVYLLNVSKWATGTGPSSPAPTPAGPTSAPAGPAPAPTPGTPAAASRAVNWAVGHASWYAGKYSMRYRLPVNKSISFMTSNEPPRGKRQSCDCSSYLKWAMAQGGVDIGNYTKENWTASGAMPARYSSSSANTRYGQVLRGQGTTPPGGFKVGDLIFYGVSGMGKGTGHIALYMGGGKIVHCNGSRGSNAGMRMDYYPRTGWVRYVSVSG